MLSIQQGLRAEGFEVSMVKLCRWFGVARRTVYYRPTKAPPTVKPALAEPIKALIEEEPSFGYRTVAGLLGMNKNTVQRIFQLKGWQVRKRPIGMRPRIEAVPSVTTMPAALLSAMRLPSPAATPPIRAVAPLKNTMPPYGPLPRAVVPLLPTPM